MKRTIAVFVASNGYQPIEYGVPKGIFESHGHKVITVSDKPGIAHAKDKSTTKVDQTISAFDVTSVDAIVLIGGPGALEHLDNQQMHEIVEQAANQQKVVAAICVSPRILANAGVLAARKATGWDDDDQLTEFFRRHGVMYIKDQAVVVDGLFVTATGPEVAADFARAIFELL